MKKRQRPILLVTLLILLVGGAVAMNMATNAKPGPGPEQMQADQHADEAPKALGETRIADNAKVGEDAASKLKPTAKPKPMGGSGLVLPKATSNKPVPNESSTGAQWYTDESGAAKGKK